MHIDNPTGYDTKLLKKLCLYIEKHWQNRVTARDGLLHLRYVRPPFKESDVTWNSWKGLTIRVPRGYCSTTSVARFLYGFYNGAWPPSGGEFNDEILARFPVALFDNPSRLKTGGRRRSLRPRRST